MLYFKNLPTISYPDGRGNSIFMKDLTTRIYIVSKMMTNPLSFYQYKLKEKETPEIVAEKYYGNPDDYWLVMISNLLKDPQWDWPLSEYNLNKYIIDKYGSYEASLETHHYEKIITYTNMLTGDKQEIITEIGEDEYTQLVPYSKECTLPDIGTVDYTLDKTSVTNYNYEVAVNESRRTINLIDKSLAPDIMKQFRILYGYAE